MNFTHDLALLLGRFMLGALHLIFAFDRFMELQTAVGWYGRLGVPLPHIAAPLAGVVMGLSGLLLVIGWKTRFAALLYAAFILLDACVVRSGLVNANDRTYFLFDLAVAGGCLAFYAAGAGRFSIDGRDRSQAQASTIGGRALRASLSKPARRL